MRLFRFAEEGRKIWSKFWKVLSTNYHRHPKITTTGLACAICTSFHWPGARPAHSVPLKQDRHAQR